MRPKFLPFVRIFDSSVICDIRIVCDILPSKLIVGLLARYIDGLYPKLFPFCMILTVGPGIAATAAGFIVNRIVKKFILSDRRKSCG
jgi:hypothetical protein